MTRLNFQGLSKCLTRVVRYCSTEILAAVIDSSGVRVPLGGIRQEEPLVAAIELNKLDAVTLLLDKWADVHATHGSVPPVFNVVGVEVAKLLLHKGAQTYSCTHGYPDTLLSYLYKQSRFGVLIELLESDVEFDVNVPCGRNFAPLLWTVLSHDDHERQVQLVRLLLDRGARINFADRDGLTMIMEACRSGSHCCATVDLLLDHGANVNDVDSGGCTALRYAVQKQCDRCELAILRKG